MKEVDLDEPTSFLDHVYLGCTQHDCKPNEDIIQQYNEMSESHTSGGATENYLGGTNFMPKTMARPASYSLVTLLKTTLEHMLFLLKKARLRPR